MLASDFLHVWLRGHLARVVRVQRAPTHPPPARLSALQAQVEFLLPSGQALPVAAAAACCTSDAGSGAGHRVHSACVGDRRAARLAGSSPASGPMSRAAPRPPAQASGGMTIAQPLIWAIWRST